MRNKNFKSLGTKKVLVADDVELNRALVRHILERWGFEVDLAHDGKEAVAMMKRKMYDLVLMDIQMPEMDGIEATLAIRDLPDAALASIPIIALTANVREGDTEKYLAAGMNDCLAKPFDESKLFSVIEKNLCNGSVPLSSPLNEKKMKHIDSVIKMYDLAMVEAIAGTDPGFIKRMVQLFLDTMPSMVNDLQSASKQQNWEVVSKLAHKMKSTIDSMGIIQLREDIRALEGSGKKHLDASKISLLVNRVAQKMQNCTDQIKKDFGL